MRDKREPNLTMIQELGDLKQMQLPKENLLLDQGYVGYQFTLQIFDIAALLALSSLCDTKQ